jgi:hypothetical protein
LTRLEIGPSDLTLVALFTSTQTPFGPPQQTAAPIRRPFSLA